MLCYYGGTMNTLNGIDKLVDGTIVREEPFGFFLAFPDGEMGFFEPSILNLVKLGTVASVPKNWFLPYRISSSEKLRINSWNFALNHPLIVMLELTTKCDCSCQLCYINGGKPRPNEMTNEQMRNLWQQLVESNVCCVLLTGGETSLHPLLLEAIQYFHSNGVVVSLATNGNQLNKEFISGLPRSDFGMGISIDSYTNNKKIRGGLSSFELLESKLKLLQEAEIPFNIITTLSKLNIDEILPLIDWCRKNDVMLETVEAQPLGRALVNSHLLLTEEDLSKDAVIYRAKEELEDEYESRHYRSGRFFSGFLESSYQYTYLTGRCEGGRTIAYITSEGDVYPCSNCASLGILSTGNVIQKPFEEIWLEGFLEIRSITWKDFHDCRNCEISKLPYYCPSRCPALSYSKTGEFTKPGCSLYMKGVVLQRTHIHDKMHTSQGEESVFGIYKEGR